MHKVVDFIVKNSFIFKSQLFSFTSMQVCRMQKEFLKELGAKTWTRGRICGEEVAFSRSEGLTIFQIIMSGEAEWGGGPAWPFG